MAANELTVHFKQIGLDEVNAKMAQYDARLSRLVHNTNGTVNATGRVAAAQNNLASATDNAGRATNRAGKAQESYAGHIAKTTIMSAAINKLFLEFVDVSGQAVQAVDLMNNFPATMASMGESTAEATEAFKALQTYVGQIGGNIGEATSAVTRFTGVTKDVKSAVAIFQGINNALIAGDSSAQEQKLAMIQFAQALERGKPDMREWLALTQNMSFQLAQVAKSMGYVNANELGAALREGEESMANFTTELTKLSTGQGPIAQQALARMQGTQFAFNVMKNTMVQGLATIINAFGRSNIVAFFNVLTQTIRVLTSWVINLMNVFASLFNLISRIFGGPQIGKITGDVKSVADNLKGGAGAADDLGKGMKKAGKEAEKIKKSLAGFDKMNVLADPASDKDKDDDKAGGSTQFDPAQLAGLNSMFGDIGGGLQEASKWAKILAGVLAGLAANALINRIFGVNPLKLFGKTLGSKVIVPLAKSVPSAAATAAKSVGTFGAALGRGLLGKGSGGAGVMGEAAGFGARIGLAIRAGMVTALAGVGTALKFAIITPLATIGGAVATALGIATAPLWLTVAIGAAVVAALVALFWVIWKNWDEIWGFIKATARVSWDFIKEVASAFWDWLVGKWQRLYEIFEGPVKYLWQVIEGIFIVIVAIVAIALESVFKLWVGTWKLILGLLAGAVMWINQNVIQPVWQFFQGLWDGITRAVAAAWQWIFENVLRPIGSWIGVNVVAPVLNIFRSLWNTVAGFVSGFFNRAKEILGGVWGWIRHHVVDRIANLFSGLWNGVQHGLWLMINGIRSIFGGIANIFKTPLNGIIDLINGAINGLNRMKVPDWVPKFGGRSPGLPHIPRLARGGVVEEATMAMLGEGGKEAVVPLENNTEWIDTLAEKIGSSRDRDNDTHIPSKLDKQPSNNITIQVSGVFATSVAEQRRVADLIAKRINESLGSRGLQGAR